MVDDVEDAVREPWHACRTAWCRGAIDHVSMSLINREMTAVYPDGKRDVGFVLDATVLQPVIACAMTTDGGTSTARLGGCESRCTCGPGCRDWCVYRRWQIESFARASMSRIQPCLAGQSGAACDRPYTEIVIPTTDWEAALPASIAAVMCLQGGLCAEARAVHNSLLSAYGITSAQVPLVHYQRTEPELGFADISDRS